MFQRVAGSFAQVQSGWVIFSKRVLRHRVKLCRNYQSTKNEASVEEKEKEFTQLRIQSGIHEWSNDPKHVLVVHPKIRWGAESIRDEEAALKLEEACALVQTLPGFSVAG
uniref:Y1_Tnp domain-containing protein n=2 Tax=Bursaphelenchus xylophilus TaxID=6326 RepID=A0A1I7S2M4_BURXY